MPVDRLERKRWMIALVVFAVIGVLLRVRALEIGLLSDDYMQHAMIAGLYPGENYAPFDLYAFVRADADLIGHIDMGTVPWFAESEFSGSVLRPISSLLLWLDHTLAPGQVRLWHAHSLLWLGLAIFSFGLCVRSLLPRWPAALAVALFVCDLGFVSPVGWLANRCVLVSAAFGFAAIFVHLEWRRPEPATRLWLRRYGPLVELALFAGSLGGGEYGLGAAAYVGAWELFGHDRRWSERWRSVVPAVLVVAGYLGIYKLLDYGTFGATVYADPLHDPSGWWRWAQLRLPQLATGAFWSIPAETISVFEHPAAAWWQERWPAQDSRAAFLSHTRMAAVGVALAAVALGLARFGLEPDERRTLRTGLIGAGLGLLPISVAPSHSRLLVFTQLGVCVAVALIVLACARLLAGSGPREKSSRPSGPERLLGAVLVPFAGALLLLHTWGDLRWNHRYLLHLDGIAASDELAFTEGDLLEQPLADRDVIVLNGPSQAVGMYGRFVLATMDQPIPASWRSLALGGMHAIFVSRPDRRTLELTAIQGAWLQTAGELFFRRDDRPLTAGSKLDYPGVDIRIVADQDGHPTRIRFRFPHDLDDPRYLFLTSTDRGLNHWPVPPVLGTAVVPLPAVPFPADLVEL